MELLAALESLEAAPRGNARLAALKALAAECRDLFPFVVATVDPFVTFGVQKLPDDTLGSDFFSDSHSWWEDLCELGEKLAARELTGNAAQKHIAAHLGACTPVRLKWSQRYLLRDLRLNIGAREVQKTFGKEVVRTFEVPLATDYKKVKFGTDEQWVGQPKLDGARCVAMVDAGGGVQLLSRTGKAWKNFESIRKAVESLGLTDTVLDGEVVVRTPDGGIDFQALQGNMMRDDGIETGTLQYIVFDACNTNEWTHPCLAYGDRWEHAHLFCADRHPAIQCIECLPMDSVTPDALNTLCRAYVDRGYEGAILRRFDVPVENKRGRRLLKVKTFTDAEGQVVGVAEGEGRLAATLGALKCIWHDGIAFEIGTGFSDALRDQLWKDPPIGARVTFKYFEITNDGAPRFPVFKCVRVAEDLPGDDSE